MKKILLIGASSVNDSPYIQSYIEVYERNGIAYDLLFWNRHLDSTEELPDNNIPYNQFTDNKYPYWKKILKIWGFARFASKQMKKEDYAYVVVFTIAQAVFMYPTLKRLYKNRYIFDIRDYSPMCNVGFLHRVINRLIEYSSFTVVSSAGFLRWLPTGDQYRYMVAHNTTKSMLEKYVDNQVITPPHSLNEILILTIGQLRDFEANSELMDALKGMPKVKMVFSGSGPASDSLKEYANVNHIANAEFTGRYKKADEEGIVLNHHMMNVVLGRDINSNSLMTNRFYLSVLMRKPMIANEGTFQADVVKKYGLGIVLGKQDNIGDSIFQYWNKLDWVEYNNNCKKCIRDVLNDFNTFEQKIISL